MSSDGDRLEPASVVKRFLDRQRAVYRGAPVDGLREMLADDIVWHVPGRSPIAGDYRGASSAIGYMLARRTLAGGEMRVIKHAELAHGDVVVQVADGEANLADQPCSWRTIGVYRVARGKVAEAWLVPLELASFDEMWSATRQSGFTYSQRVRPQGCAVSTALGHPRLLEFLEAAFVEYWRSQVGPLDASLGDERQITMRSVDVEYLAPVRVDDLVEIEVFLDQISERTIQLFYRAFVADRSVANARSRYVCLDDSGAPAPWPDNVRDQLQPT